MNMGTQGINNECFFKVFTLLVFSLKALTYSSCSLGTRNEPQKTATEKCHTNYETLEWSQS